MLKYVSPSPKIGHYKVLRKEYFKLAITGSESTFESKFKIEFDK